MQNVKLKTKIQKFLKVLFLIIFTSAVLLIGSLTRAERIFVQPLQQAHIKYEQVGWQTYDFYAATNLSAQEPLKYEWNVDGRETFKTDRIRYFFTRGEHLIQIKVEDKYGNIETDNVKLTIGFWSLQNNWFWWVLYLFAILLIIYYWIIKIIYLFNKKRISKQVRCFLDILDEHGWIEKIIERREKCKNR